MEIYHLSNATLKQAIQLVEQTFPNASSSLFNKPAWDVITSLWSENNLIKRLRFSLKKVKNVEYWVATSDESSSTVTGIIGLYQYLHDCHEAYWVGWFCVRPDYQGQGIGKALLRFVIDETKHRKKPFLRLYTSNSDRVAKAQFLYHNMGFKTFKEKAFPNGKVLFYKQLELE